MRLSIHHGRLPVLLLMLMGITIAISTPQSRSPDCRCRPSDSCWPSVRQWEAFNKTINGNLLHLRPIGSVCHGADANQGRCEDAMTNSNSTIWRIAQPGALLALNWETRGETETCFLESAQQNTTCYQGRIPEYSVLAESEKEIQAAVRFAKRHNIHLVIRNTGHDGTGRSSGPGSLQINTSQLKRLQFVDEFIPRGGRRSLGSAVTAGTGMLGIDLLEAAGAHGLNIISGTASSVGCTGGFLLGGGTGLLGPLRGMGSDNALEFRVVTADGSIVTANHIQNSDLFWALRGGGGGTFGVVVEVTIRTYPDVPAVAFSLIANLAGETANQSIWDVTREIATAFPELKRWDDTTGAIMITGVAADYGTLEARILFPKKSDIQSTRAQFTTLFQALDGLGFPYTSNFTTYPLVSSYLTEPSGLIGDYGRLEGSVFVSEDLFYQENATSNIFEVISDLEYQPGDTIEYLMTGGGQVKANKDTIDSALQPSWRESSLLITLRRMLPTTSTEKIMSNNQMPRLRALETPYLGSYLNVGDPEEPDFQTAFWGDNYERLRQIKGKWDPDSVFIVNMGVGSEDWDDEGLCRA
ncbi:FAD-binding domain-containing protein [Aspergillus californicus]